MSNKPETPALILDKPLSKTLVGFISWQLASDTGLTEKYASIQENCFRIGRARGENDCTYRLSLNDAKFIHEELIRNFPSIEGLHSAYTQLKNALHSFITDISDGTNKDS